VQKLALTFLFTLLFTTPSFAQTINFDMNAGGENLSSSVLRMIVLLTILSIAPSILMMVTSFTRIVIVLSLLRSAIGLQQTPPNSVLVSLAIFLTFFIMQPTFERAYNDGIKPLTENKINEKEALEKTAKPFHEFMLKNTRTQDISLFLDLSERSSGKKIEIQNAEETPYSVLIPAFLISELKRAFEIGFLIFIPFLIIDMVVASILMSMGMMMLPPVVISLPFKIIFFVLVDGWAKLSESLVLSFG
jgi:flagellar biosynthetic protein FliP